MTVGDVHGRSGTSLFRLLDLVDDPSREAMSQSRCVLVAYEVATLGRVAAHVVEEVLPVDIVGRAFRSTEVEQTTRPVRRLLLTGIGRCER